ncbi:MAG: type II secretion system F family protein [Spirochaetaceae bacterium]
MSARQVETVYLELSRMLEAGLSVPEAVAALPPTPERREMLERIWAGEAFSAALGSSFQRVAEIECGLLRIGEEAGVAPVVLRRLAERRRREREATGTLLQVAAYPVVVLVLLLLVSGGFAGIVLPMAAESAAAFDAAAAERVRGAAKLLGALVPLLVIAAGGAVTAVAVIRRVSQCPGSLGERTDRAVMRSSLLGAVVTAQRCSRLFFAVEIALTGGASFDKAVEAAASAVSGAAFRSECEVLARALRSGDSVSAAVERLALFPRSVGTWMRAAEAGVPTVQAVAELRGYFERLSTERLRWFSQAVEPLLIALVGSMLVVFVVIAVLPVIGSYGSVSF